jgi:predicted nucleic acid-binding Zn ribbon protein
LRDVALCKHCGAAIGGRSDRRFCDPACRVAAHRERHRVSARARRLRLVERVDAAEPHIAEVALAFGITEAAREDWRAAAWLLERQFPERYALRPREPDDLDDD